MTGHSEANAAFNHILWPDAEIEGIAITYDTITITALESNGRTIAIQIGGYIGYQLVGFWDEIVVDSAELLFDHPLIASCIASLDRRYKLAWPETGSPSRNLRSWFALLIHLSDGATLEVVGTTLNVSLVPAKDSAT